MLIVSPANLRDMQADACPGLKRVDGGLVKRLPCGDPNGVRIQGVVLSLLACLTLPGRTDTRPDHGARVTICRTSNSMITPPPASH